MNNPKQQETKPPDGEDGDHSQPINLAASRPPVTPGSLAITFSGMTVPVATQPVSSRAHGEVSKPGQMTLYFCTPSSTRPQGPGHIMSPIMGTDVSSSQHYAAKPAFKKVKVGYYQEKPGEKATFGTAGNEVNIKVIRMPPTDSSQAHSVGVSQPMTPGILPSALPNVGSRHIVPAAVHPVLPAGGSLQSSMASIIKTGSGATVAAAGGSGHQVSQHVIHQHYSSHVPRGPAAVASISAGPKSAVATPILRAPACSGTMTLASSMISSHASVRARSPTLVTGRTSIPPTVSSTTGHPQVIDLQKSSTGLSLTNQPHLSLASRSGDIAIPSPIRAGVVGHGPSVTVAKTVSVSQQPIVQHLQQMSDKSYQKPITGISSSASGPASNTTLSHHQAGLSSTHASTNEVQSVCVVPSMTRTTLSNISGSGACTAGIVQLPSGTSLPQHLPTLRPSLVQPQALHSLTSSTTQVGSRQAFAVISAKSLSSGNQSVTLATSLSRTSVSAALTSTNASKSGQPLSLAPTARILNAPNTAAIPIAKVYPQALPAVAQGATDAPYSGEATKLAQMGAPHTIAMTATKANTAIPTTVAAITTVWGVSSSISAPVVTSVSSGTPITTVWAVSGSISAPVVTSVTSPAVLLSEKCGGNVTAVRFASFTKQPGSSGTSFAAPSAAYLYPGEHYSGALSVNPYSVQSQGQAFSSATATGQQFRPLALSQHSSGGVASGTHGVSSGIPSSSSASSMQPLMVAVDSRHVALPYNRVTIGGAKAAAELVQHPATTCSSQNSSSAAAAASLIAVSQTPAASGNAGQNLGGNQSHLSPRPSILRKRTTEPVTSTAKRNLMASLSTPEQDTIGNEYSSGVARVISPKLSPSQTPDSVASSVAPDNERDRRVTSTSNICIKKELELNEKSHSVSSIEISNKDSQPAETSPRKKPRKQLLAANELIETHSSDGEENFEGETKDLVAKEPKTEEDENVKWVTFGKRPSMSLLSSYRTNWKSRHNHFNRYSDVKPKEEKPTSISEIVNQKNILEEANGWKVYHLTGQIEDLIEYEESIYKRLSVWLQLEENPSLIFGNDVSSEDKKLISKLTDLVKGNLQRSKIAQEQATECQQQLMKMMDHKAHVVDIVNKYASRRPLKKKDKS